MLAAMSKLFAGVMLSVVAALAACGGAPAKPTPKAATCADVAASARAAWIAGPGSEAPEAAQLAPAIAEVVAERCAADAWAPAAMECLARATDDAFEACGKQLTDAQREALATAMAAKVAPQTDQMMRQSDGTEGGEGSPPPPSSKGTTDPCGADE
jgi:hypothetical protein